MAWFDIVLIMVIFRSQLVCLIDIAPVEDNVIVTTEAHIRAILMKVVRCFDVELETGPLMERYMRVHDQLVSGALAAAGDWPELRRRAAADVDASMADQIETLLHQSTDQSTNRDLLIEIVDSFLKHVDQLQSEYDSELIVQAYMHTELMLKNTSSDEQYEDVEEPSYEDEDDADTSEVWSPENNSNTGTRRIYFGVSASITSYPFIAAIMMFGLFQCAGAILSSDLVLTAASGIQLAYNNRLFRENPRLLEVRVGSSFHALRGELIGVQEVYFHPSYNPRTLNNNICLLRLVRHINFRGPRRRQVKKIEFDKMESAMPLNIGNVTMVGWGAKQPGNKVRMEVMLSFTRLAVYSYMDCQDIYSTQYVTPKNFCAGHVSVGGGACNRDVGDPAIVDGVLYGIVSFGAPVCGAPDSPTVFTKLGYYADWIETIMEQKVPSKRTKTTITTRFVPSIEYITVTMSTTEYSVQENEYNMIRIIPTSTSEKDILRIQKEPFYSGRTVIANKKHVKQKHYKETKTPHSDSFDHSTTKKHHRHHNSHRHESKKHKKDKKHIKDKNSKKDKNGNGKKNKKIMKKEPNYNIYKESHDLQIIEAIKTTIPSKLFDVDMSEVQTQIKKKRKQKKQNKLNLIELLKPELQLNKTLTLSTRKMTFKTTVTRNIKNVYQTLKLKNRLLHKPPLISKYKLRDLLRPIPKKVPMFDLIDSDKIKLTNKMKKEIHSQSVSDFNESSFQKTTNKASTITKKNETDRSYLHKIETMDQSDKTEMAKDKISIGGLMDIEQTYPLDYSPNHKVHEQEKIKNAKVPNKINKNERKTSTFLKQHVYKITPDYSKYTITSNGPHYLDSSDSDYYYLDSEKEHDINKHQLNHIRQNKNYTKHIYGDSEDYSKNSGHMSKKKQTEYEHEYNYNDKVFKPDYSHYSEYGSMEEKYGGVKPNQHYDYYNQDNGHHQSIEKNQQRDGDKKIKEIHLKHPHYYDDEPRHSNLTLYSDYDTLDIEDIEYIEQKTLELKRRNNTLSRNFPNNGDTESQENRGESEIKLPKEIEGLGSYELKQILTQLINRAKLKEKRAQNIKYPIFKSKYNTSINGLIIDDLKSSNDGNSFYEKLRSIN